VSSAPAENIVAAGRDLDLIVNGVRLVSLTFGMTLYTNQPLTKIGGAILELHHRFLETFPAHEFKYYATENMHAHKPAKKSTLTLLNTWLKPDAVARDYVVLELKDGEQFQAAPKWKFQVWGDEEGSTWFKKNNAKLISMAFPPEFAAERPNDLLNFFVWCCQTLPFVSGLAGLSFEYSRYEAVMSITHAWQKSMRYRGIDISYPVIDKIAVSFDGMKGVNWLTAVSDTLLTEVGGMSTVRKRLPAGVETIPVKAGVVFRAGERPRLGDRNRQDFLPEYQAAYRVLQPLIERAVARSKAFELDGSDYLEKTRTWMKRLAG